MKNLPVVLFVDHDEQKLNAFKITFRNLMRIFVARSSGDAREIMDRNEIHVLISPAGTNEMPGGLLLEESVRISPRPVRLLLGQTNDEVEFFHVPGLTYPVRCLRCSYSEAELIDAVFDAFFEYQLDRENAHPVELHNFDTLINNLEEVVRTKRQLIRNLIDQA
jgi:hypothetical protein